MGKKAVAAKQKRIREFDQMSESDRGVLATKIFYEGSPTHKARPYDFGLVPPFAPRPDKTLCDEAGVNSLAYARELLEKAAREGVVSKEKVGSGLPKRLWVVADDGQVFEAIYGGSRPGAYHGYPLRRGDPLTERVKRESGILVRSEDV